MSEKSRYDRILERMDIRLMRVQGRIAKDFKNTQPFNTIKEPKEVTLAKYMMVPDEVKQKMRQDYPQQYGDYESKMESMIRRQTNA
jgi:hypothetical protein